MAALPSPDRHRCPHGTTPANPSQDPDLGMPFRLLRVSMIRPILGHLTGGA